MPIKGMPGAKPEEPEYKDIPEDATRAQKKQIKLDNKALTKQHRSDVSQHDSMQSRFDNVLFNNSLTAPPTGPDNELEAACTVRDNLSTSMYSPGINYNAIYTDPSQLIADMWTEGYLSSEEAKPLLAEFNENGKAGSHVNAFLRAQKEQHHISTQEFEFMRDYQKEKPKQTPAQDEAVIRQTIMNGLLESGLPPADALRYAMEVEDNITRDPLDLPAAPKQSHSERILAERDQAAKTPTQRG